MTTSTMGVSIPLPTIGRTERRQVGTDFLLYLDAIDSEPANEEPPMLDPELVKPTLVPEPTELAGLIDRGMPVPWSDPMLIPPSEIII